MTMWTTLTLLIALAHATAGLPVATDPPGTPAKRAAEANAAPAVVVPPGYTIGPDDHLAVVFWRDTELSAEVVVRPDGRISLPLLNDVMAAGLTPDQLRER